MTNINIGTNIIGKREGMIAKGNKDWREIHPDFTSEFQARWEDLGFDYQETKDLIEKGLKVNDADFAYFLRKKNQYEKEGKVLRKVCISIQPGKIDAQKWLNETYPKDMRKKISKLNIIDIELNGGLVINKWVSLKEINVLGSKIDKLILNNLPELTKISCGLNFLLSDLVISDCPVIEHLDARDTYSLANLDFLNKLNPERLTYFNIGGGNECSSCDLSLLSNFVNLEYIDLGNGNFRGSLEALKKLSKLKWISIWNTKVGGGLEYLPKDLGEIVLRKKAKTKLNEELEEHRKSNRDIDVWGYYDYRSWKETQPYFKWLKEELEKLNPNLDVYDVIKNIFFNVKTGEFVGNHQAMTSLLNINKVIIEEKELKVSFLEYEIQELTNLVKQQKEKIVQAYLCFASENERESLKELVTKYFEYIKFKKQGINSSDYGRRCREYKRGYEKIEDELWGKLEESVMNGVQRILTDCEELVQWEVELENKINVKRLTIENRKNLIIGDKLVTGLTQTTKIEEIEDDYDLVSLPDNEVISLSDNDELNESFELLEGLRQSLTELVSTAHNKFKKYEEKYRKHAHQNPFSLLDELSIIQQTLIRYQLSLSSSKEEKNEQEIKRLERTFERTKDDLLRLHVLNKEELDDIFLVQGEVFRLENQLEKKQHLQEQIEVYHK